MYFVDTHAHLDDERLYEDLDGVLSRAAAAGVRQVITVGYDLASSRAAVTLATQHKGVFAAVGIHPHDAVTASRDILAELSELARDPRVVAWGEIGLDYYYDNSPREQQRDAFIAQIKIANDMDLPVIIHSRDASADTVAILRATRPKRGVLHCYAGSLGMVQELEGLDLFFGAGGPITFKNAKRPPEVFAALPLSRIVLETDSPYLAPAPHRGKTNEPAFVVETGKRLARLKGISIDELRTKTTANARNLFGLPDDEFLDA